MGDGSFFDVLVGLASAREPLIEGGVQSFPRALQRPGDAFSNAVPTMYN